MSSATLTDDDANEGISTIVEESAASRFDMAGKVVLITGGNSGIGLGIAARLASAGATLMVTGRREEQNEAAVAALSNLGTKVDHFVGDASDEASVEAAVQRAVERFGRLDTAIACAGGIVGERAGFLDLPSASWQATLALNLNSVFYLFQHAAWAMDRHGDGGSLLAISSVAAVRASPTLHYAAAKGGVCSLVMNVAGQLGPKRIRANAILPGFIDTPLTASALRNDKLHEAIKRRIPLGHVGHPRNVADLALLLSSEAGAFITGQQFIIDGGMTTN